MSIPFTANSRDGKQVVSIFLKGKVFVVFKDEFSDYAALIEALTEGNEKKVVELVDRYEAARMFATGIPGLKAEITPDHSEVVYKFEDTTLDGEFAKYLEEVRARDDAPTLMRFFELLRKNPSANSRKYLFEFLKRYKIKLSDDGCILIYKGVNNNFTSSHSGPGSTSWLENGEFKTETRPNWNIPNKLGHIVSIPREKVVDDPRQGCSSGLHVGSQAYASDFASKLLVVKVNPADVVSVPHDCNYAKIRCSRYQVLADISNVPKSQANAELDKWQDSKKHHLNGVNMLLHMADGETPQQTFLRVKSKAQEFVNAEATRKAKEVSPKVPPKTVKKFRSTNEGKRIISDLEVLTQNYNSDSRVSKNVQEQVEKAVDAYSSFYQKQGGASTSQILELKNMNYTRNYQVKKLIAKLKDES